MLRDNRGVISMLFVIVLLIVMIAVMGFIGILNRTMAINEVQGIMDTTGVIALRKAVDESKAREGELYVDESAARNNFIQTLNESLSGYVGGNRMIESYNIQSVRVMKGSSSTVGVTQGIDDYYIEAVTRLTYSTYSLIDGVNFHSLNFYDFLSSGENSSITVSSNSGDGKVNVLVRTVSKITLRNGSLN